jgi:hypothetical protein
MRHHGGVDVRCRLGMLLGILGWPRPPRQLTGRAPLAERLTSQAPFGVASLQ